MHRQFEDVDTERISAEFMERNETSSPRNHYKWQHASTWSRPIPLADPPDARNRSMRGTVRCEEPFDARNRLMRGTVRCEEPFDVGTITPIGVSQGFKLLDGGTRRFPYRQGYCNACLTVWVTAVNQPHASCQSGRCYDRSRSRTAFDSLQKNRTGTAR